MANWQTGWPQAGPRSGWVGSQLHIDELTFPIAPAGLEILRSRAGKLLRMPGAAGEPDSQFTPESAVSAFLAPVIQMIKHGPGIVLLRGLDPSRDSLEELGKMFWLIGRHIGSPLSQNAAGERLTRVEATDGARQGVLRAYLSDGSLSFHTDPTEILALLCVRQAQSGGVNRFVSSLQVREVIAREFPEHLPALERGFRYSRLDEQPPGAAPITPYQVPVFATARGLMSCCWVGRVGAQLAAQQGGAELSAAQAAALEVFEQVAGRIEHQFHALLEPGDIVFVNNYEVMHARESFQDSGDPARKRLLLRLWLECDPSRPLSPQMYIHQNASGRNGVDPVPGGSGGRAWIRRTAPRAG